FTFHLCVLFSFLISNYLYLFSDLLWPAPACTLFPYTTLFRSLRAAGVRAQDGREVLVRQGAAAFTRFFPDHAPPLDVMRAAVQRDRKSTRLNSSHGSTSYAVFCLKKNNESAHKELTTKRLYPS